MVMTETVIKKYWRFEIINSDHATTIQYELMDSKEAIEFLKNQPWFIALRHLERRWEQANYNQDGDAWIDIPKESSDAKACWKLNKLFPNLLKISSVGN